MDNTKMACAFLAMASGVTNAGIALLFFLGSEWAEEIGLYLGILIIGTLIGCSWQCLRECRGIIIISWGLSLPMVGFWCLLASRLLGFALYGDT